jgi:hypothetical protein
VNAICYTEVATESRAVARESVRRVGPARLTRRCRANTRTCERPGRRRTVDREYQHALDEARDRAVSYGIVDDREEVVRHWQEAKSWLVAPVAMSAELLGGGGGFELLVAFTRFGNLVGMLDRMEVPEIHKHLVWVGRELIK